MKFELTIEGLAAGGWGVGRREGKVVFVPLTAPGDVIRCAVTQDRGRFAFGVLVDLLRPSPDRVTAPCPVFGRCGGCQWQHIGYGRQIEAKRSILADALTRIGRQHEAVVSAAAGSPRQYGWRVAVDLAFTADGTGMRVGFMARQGSEIVPITECPVAADEINARVRNLAGGLADACPGASGAIKLVAGIGGRVSAHLTVEGAAGVQGREAGRLCRAAEFSGIEITGKRGRSVYGDPTVAYPGWDGTEEVGLSCRPSGFVQANPGVNRGLIDRLLSLGLAGKAVLELYCGMGNLTVPMARAGARVTGVEASRASLADAARTVEAIGLADVTFAAGRVERVLSDRSVSRRRWDTIVLDPPRTGARVVMERIADMAADEIVYVSCSPPTLARDLSVLTGRGWRLVSVVPMDMFPQTFHTEALCRLTRG